MLSLSDLYTMSGNENRRSDEEVGSADVDAEEEHQEEENGGRNEQERARIDVLQEAESFEAVSSFSFLEWSFVAFD